MLLHPGKQVIKHLFLFGFMKHFMPALKYFYLQVLKFLLVKVMMNFYGIFAKVSHRVILAT